jgi:hypothetical protein
MTLGQQFRVIARAATSAEDFFLRPLAQELIRHQISVVLREFGRNL